MSGFSSHVIMLGLYPDFHMTNDTISILPLLACPYDGQSLQQEGVWTTCPRGHSFPIVENVPVLLRDDVLQTIGIASESLRLARIYADGHNRDCFFTSSLALSDDERRKVRAGLAENSRG